LNEQKATVRDTFTKKSDNEMLMAVDLQWREWTRFIDLKCRVDRSKIRSPRTRSQFLPLCIDFAARQNKQVLCENLDVSCEGALSYKRNSSW